MIRKMIRVAIWGLISRQTEIVSFLHEEGVLHLEYGEAAQISAQDSDSLRLLRGKLLGMIESLKWGEWNDITDEDLKRVDSKIDLPFSQMISEIDKSLDHFKIELSSLFKRQEDLQRAKIRLKTAKDTISRFKSFIETHSKENMHVSLWWVRMDRCPQVVESIQSIVESRWSVTGNSAGVRHHLFPVREKEALLSLAVPPELGDLVCGSMESMNNIRWTSPVSDSHESLLSSIEKIELALSKIPGQEKDLEETLSRVRVAWGRKLACLFMIIDERLERLVAEQGAVKMGSTFLLEGWLPDDERNDFCQKIKDAFGDSILIRWRYPASDEWQRIPTAIANPGVFKPFEIFLKLVPLPNYRGTDPTTMIGIFFPFFAGCIIGDGGYGVILGLLAWWMIKTAKNEIVSDVAYVLITMAVWSVIWGIAYGEFFGDLAHRVLGINPLWVERSHAVIPVLSFTIALGLGHILIGLGLGVLEGIRNKNSHIWMERSGNAVIILAMVGVLCSLKGIVPQSFFSLSVGSLIIGLVLLIAGGGIGGIVEAMSSFGSVLSYVRIGAIGLSSAILAMVASKFVDVLGISFIGVFIALAIHLLNFVLAIAESGLHSARLHYVEFMGKFYTGGGNQYRPFSRKRRNI